MPSSVSTSRYTRPASLRRRRRPDPAPERQGRDSRQPDRAPSLAGAALPGHHRLRRHGRAADRQRDAVAPQLHPARLRGQAKTRILRALVGLLDEAIPVVPGCEIHDDPLAPLCAACRDARPRKPVTICRSPGSTAMPATSRSWRRPTSRSRISSATWIRSRPPAPGLQLSDELTMHYGLLPRANRGVFAVNELPDLAGKVQVGLFNILQEGDVQIKGYPVRLPLDVMLVFSANPEDYTARGKIITPLKDRIGSEIRTHYPATRQHAMAITAQEAWVTRDTLRDGRFRRSSAKSSRRSHSRRARIRRSTSARASASACPSRCSRTSSRAPSGVRCWRTSRPSCRASPTSTRRCRQ